jgi:hypothetical protein
MKKKITKYLAIQVKTEDKDKLSSFLNVLKSVAEDMNIGVRSADRDMEQHPLGRDY